MVEFEPRKEVKFPICGGCEKPVDILDMNKGYCKSGDTYFHLNHFKIKDRTPEEIIFRESPINTKESSTWSSMKEVYNARKEEIRRKLKSIDKGGKII